MNKKIKQIAVFLGMLALGLTLTACSTNKDTKKATPKKPEKVSITYVQAPLNVPSIVEKANQSFEKKFKEKDIPVTYSTITSGADQTAALASGDIQFLNCVGGSSVLLSAANGADIKIISLYSQAPKAFKLFSKDAAITSPQSLKGKTIAGPKGTILHELLAAYLKQGGLSIEDVKFVSMGLPQARAALENGSADCALLAGPWLIRKNRKACMLLQLVTALFQVLQSRQRAGSSIKNTKSWWISSYPSKRRP